MHRSGGLDAYQHRVRKLRIKLPYVVTFVHQDEIHCFSSNRFQHRQRLLASMQITSYNSHSASFGPSAVRVNAETVYSGRCEAGLVMTSTGNLLRAVPDCGLFASTSSTAGAYSVSSAGGPTVLVVPRHASTPSAVCDAMR